jgi:hypothetical protein
MREWTSTGTSATCEVKGLGTVHIFLESGAFAVDINGKRAWSDDYRRTIKAVISGMNRDIDRWEYLNSFKTK